VKRRVDPECPPTLSSRVAEAGALGSRGEARTRAGNVNPACPVERPGGSGGFRPIRCGLFEVLMEILKRSTLPDPDQVPGKGHSHP